MVLREAVLQTGAELPAIEAIASLVEPPGAPTPVERHVRETASMASVSAAGVNREAAGSDQAGVRANAARPDAAEEGELSSGGGGREPLMEYAGVLSLQEQEAGALFEGLNEIVRAEAGEHPLAGGGGGNGEDGAAAAGGGGLNAGEDGAALDGDGVEEPSDAEPADGAPAGAEAARLRLQREATPNDDYCGAARSVLDAWWPLFPLGRGLTEGRSLSDATLRHLFLYYDNRFAHDMPLLFHLANTKLRHDVNKAVGARVKSSSEAYAKFKELVADDGFLKLLEEARSDPKGPSARKVLKRVVNFINLSAKAVPWGTRERAAEMAKLMADHRQEGPGSIFYSMAPDDVHSPNVIRYAEPFTRYGQYPHTVDEGFWQTLRGQTADERVQSNGHDMSEGALQVAASSHPIPSRMCVWSALLTPSFMLPRPSFGAWGCFCVLS